MINEDHILTDSGLGNVPFPAQFSCVQQFCAYYKLTLDKKTDWRLTPRIIGSIHGLPNSFGILQATNGILCHIIQHNDGSTPRIFTGHIAWFVPADMHTDLFNACGVRTHHAEALQRARNKKREEALKMYD